MTDWSRPGKSEAETLAEADAMLIGARGLDREARNRVLADVESLLWPLCHDVEGHPDVLIRLARRNGTTVAAEYAGMRRAWAHRKACRDTWMRMATDGGGVELETREDGRHELTVADEFGRAGVVLTRPQLLALVAGALAQPGVGQDVFSIVITGEGLRVALAQDEQEVEVRYGHTQVDPA